MANPCTDAPPRFFTNDLVHDPDGLTSLLLLEMAVGHIFRASWSALARLGKTFDRNVS